MLILGGVGYGAGSNPLAGLSFGYGFFFLIFSFIYYHKPRLEHLNSISILCVNNLILIEQKENTEYGREIGIH